METENQWFLDIDQVCKALGMSDSTIRRCCKQKVDPIPHFKVGGKLKFDPEEVKKWVKKHRAA
jgi:excisionase family DNA binding protein